MNYIQISQIFKDIIHWIQYLTFTSSLTIKLIYWSPMLCIIIEQANTVDSLNWELVGTSLDHYWTIFYQYTIA